MFLQRCISISICLSAIALGACSATDGEAEAEVDLDKVEAVEAATENPNPQLCSDTHYLSSREQPCGLYFDDDGDPHTLYKTCTKLCTIDIYSVLVGTPPQLACRVGQTTCGTETCEACPAPP